jgi:2-dehydro-3-deoxyphosphogluconate aldolase/(4S)-4-hydroxy-2-oxoglutarate aldolase
VKDIIEIIKIKGLLPLYFHENQQISVEVMDALYNSGIRAIEYTNRGATAERNFKVMIEERNKRFPDLKLGIGTIKNIEQAKAFISLGADFLVSPGFVPEVADFCSKRNKLYIPGCMTPTEIINAENSGIKFIKLFPGEILQATFLKSIKAIFPDLLFMPTGGVDTNIESLKAWFDAGVATVGMGSKLISKQLLDDKNYVKIASETRNVLSIINELKSR